MVGPKKLKIFSSFNTLGNDPQVQVLAHLDNCAHFGRLVGITGDSANEPSVDLKGIEEMCIRDSLDSHGVDYTEIDIDHDRAASAELVRHVGKRAIPQLVIDGEWFQPYVPGRGLLVDELRQRLGLSPA